MSGGLGSALGGPLIWGVSGLIVLVGLLVVTRRRARREQERLRALVLVNQYWLYLERSVRGAGWDTLAAQTFLEYVAKRRPGFGDRLGKVKVYRFDQRTAARQAARTVRSTWFHAIMFFIPRLIRAPWFDHLLEDRERMAAEGRSPSFIAWATAIQCAGLLVHLLWDRLWDVLTPFKPRSH